MLYESKDAKRFDVGEPPKSWTSVRKLKLLTPHVKPRRGRRKVAEIIHSLEKLWAFFKY